MSKALLVCDLDNTLYDWVAYFVPAFYAMVDEVVRITACDRERLLDDFRAVHRRHHDAEHPYAVLETQTIRDLFPQRKPSEILAALTPAIRAFNTVREQTLRLYPGVREGLDSLLASSVVLVAHTESKLHAVEDRMTRLNLTKYFRHIYCRERAIFEHPNPTRDEKHPSEFPMDRVHELSHHQRKPDPSVLLEICKRESIALSDTAYVGDSLVRDVLLAKRAGVLAIWAKYGIAHQKSEYEQLVRVTHWSAADVTREKELAKDAQQARPDLVLDRSFLELLPAILE